MVNCITLIRNKNFGMLYKGSEFLCYTLDPGILDDGLYNLEITYSPKFKRELPHIYNDNFVKSRGFRIHSGNSLKDSNGCILVGNSITYTFTLVESKKALERVLNAIKGISWLVITTSR
jgi:hypothetical protein